MSNVNDRFFDGQYKEIWRAMIPPELTVKEVDFMMSYFNLKPGSKVLDIMCGYGRHAIALARNGVEVTAIDNLGEYIEEINEVANKEALSIKAIKADAASYVADEEFDLVICMGNSLNFFNAVDTQNILHNISKHLLPGAHLLINSWSIDEIVRETFKEYSTGIIGNVSIESKSSFHSNPNRIETETTMIDDTGKSEQKKAIDYIFTLGEIEEFLRIANLTLLAKFSVPPKKIFTQGDRRAYIIGISHH